MKKSKRGALRANLKSSSAIVDGDDRKCGDGNSNAFIEYVDLKKKADSSSQNFVIWFRTLSSSLMKLEVLIRFAQLREALH